MSEDAPSPTDEERYERLDFVTERMAEVRVYIQYDRVDDAIARLKEILERYPGERQAALMLRALRRQRAAEESAEQ